MYNTEDNYDYDYEDNYSTYDEDYYDDYDYYDLCNAEYDEDPYIHY